MKEALISLLASYEIGDEKPKRNLRQILGVFKQCLDEESRTEFLSTCFNYTRFDVIRFLFRTYYLTKEELLEVVVGLQIYILQLPPNYVLATAKQHIIDKFHIPEVLLKSILKKAKFTREELIDLDIKTLAFFRENRDKLIEPDAIKIKQFYSKLFFKFDDLLTEKDLTLERKFEFILEINHIYLTTPISAPGKQTCYGLYGALNYLTDPYFDKKKKRILYSGLIDRLEENDSTYYNATKLQDLYLKLFRYGSKRNLRRLHNYLGYNMGKVGETSPQLESLVIRGEVFDRPWAALDSSRAAQLLSQGHFIYDWSFLISLAKRGDHFMNKKTISFCLYFIKTLANHPLRHFVTLTLHDQTYTRREILKLTVNELMVVLNAPSNLEIFKHCIQAYRCSDTMPLLRFFLKKFGLTDEWRRCIFRDSANSAIYELIYGLHSNDKAREEMIELLLEYGIDVNEPCYSGMRALHCAAAYDYEEIVNLLLKYGADIEAKNDNGRTALHFSGLKTSKLLVEKGANINLRSIPESKEKSENTADFATPLMKAVLDNQLDKVLWLLKNGADPYLTTANGHTALDLAIISHHFYIAFALLEHNVVPTATAIHLIANSLCRETLENLIEKQTTVFKPPDTHGTAIVIPANIASSFTSIQDKSNPIGRFSS